MIRLSFIYTFLYKWWCCPVVQHICLTTSKVRALSDVARCTRYQTFRATISFGKNSQDLTSNTPVLGAMPKKMKPPARADQSYSPLISAPERHSNDRRDVEAVCMENLFSLLNYFCFFVIGLSMMWTWYIDPHSLPLSDVTFVLTLYKVYDLTSCSFLSSPLSGEPMDSTILPGVLPRLLCIHYAVHHSRSRVAKVSTFIHQLSRFSIDCIRRRSDSSNALYTHKPQYGGQYLLCIYISDGCYHSGCKWAEPKCCLCFRGRFWSN